MKKSRIPEPDAPIYFGHVQTFADLTVYAKWRAKRSAQRNDPIAWAYWTEVRAWACMCTLDRQFWRKAIQAFLRDAEEVSSFNPMEAAKIYSRAKWLVALLRNNGERISTKGHLDWLKRVR